MLRDKLYEESAISNRSRSEAKFYIFYQVIAIIFAVAAIFIASFSFKYVPAVLAGTVAEDGTVNTISRVFNLFSYFAVIALLFGAAFLCWKLKNRFNISYDYHFVENELRITKVYNGKRRKFLTTIKGERILQIGWVESEGYKRALRGLGRGKPKRCTPNKVPAEEKEFYYIVVSSSIEKSIYVIETREIMLEYLLMAAGRDKLERK